MTVSDTVSGVLVGGLFTLAGSISVGAFHYLRTRTEVKADDRRLRAELYMARKVEALTNLHAELEECQRETLEILDKSFYGNYDDRDELEKTDQLIGEFEVAMDEASIYLSEEQHDTVLGYFATLGEANSSIKGWPFEPEGAKNGDLYKRHRKNMITGYREVKGTLRDEIQQPIDELES